MIVKSGKTLEVKVILDLTDKATDITLGKVDYRYSDGTGIISSDTAGTPDILASVGEIEELSFRFTKNKSTPPDDSLDTSSAQNNVVLAVTDVEVRKGVEGVVEDAKVKILFTNAVDLADVKALVSGFTLKIDGKQVDTINASSLAAGDYSEGVVTLEFDLGEYEVEEGDKFDVSVLANFRKYETDSGTKEVSAVKMTSLALKGYDDAADKVFDYVKATSGVSWAALYTITEGEIEVDIIDSSVAVGEPLGTATKGTITFEVTVNNESGSPLTVTKDKWVFDVKGYTLETGSEITKIEVESTGKEVGVGNENDKLSDNTEETYKVILSYVGKVSNQAFSIEVKTIDGKSIGYIWRD